MPTPSCEPGTPYNYGDIVEYQGHRYKIIQPHTFQPGWAPSPGTEALWERIIEDDGDLGEGYQQNQGSQPRQQQYYQPPQPQPPHHDQHQQDQKSEKKHWYGDDDTTKILEIGGGLLAGAALLSGGIFGHKKHEEHREGVGAWGHGNWVNEAKQRTEAYHRNGIQEPCIWVLTEGKHIPKGAISVGREHSWTLHICRAYIDGGIQPGKASDAFKKGGVLGYKNKEIHVDVYEVLIGDRNRLRWVPARGRLNVASLGYRPVQGGQENDGTLLYIAEARHDDAIHPGKASEKLDGAYIPYDGKEVRIWDYRVLCYND